MFNKLISLLVLVTPLVSGLTINAPVNAMSGESVTISWISAASDPSTFSLELINPAFNSQFALANNVQASDTSITLELPIVPMGEYTLEAVDIGNINQVFDTSPSFNIAATPSTTLSPTGSASAASIATSNTNTLPTTANPLPVTSATTPAGVSSAGTGTNTGTGTTGTGTGAASTTPSSAAASSLRPAMSNAGGYAVLLLSAVAGAAVVAL